MQELAHRDLAEWEMATMSVRWSWVSAIALGVWLGIQASQCGFDNGYDLPVSAQEPECYTLTRGPVSATDHELADGYFVISSATTVHVVPETPAWYQLRDLRQRTGRLMFCPETPKPPRQAQRLKR